MASRLKNAGVSVLCDPSMARIPWLVHGFSTRLGGVSTLPGLKGSRGELNLAAAGWDRQECVDENRRRFLKSLNAADMCLVVQHQIHSDLIRIVDQRPSAVLRGDGWITSKADLLLAIVAADCLPVLIADVRQRVVAAVHAGWRGTVQRIAQKAAGSLQLLYGSRREDLRAAIGPGIRGCCYEVGEDVAAEFESQFVYAAALLSSHRVEKSALEKKYPVLLDRWKGPRPQTTRRILLDLVAANVRQLEDGGLSREQIYSEAPCVSCHPDRFFSHRRDSGRTGRMMGVIGIRRRARA